MFGSCFLLVRLLFFDSLVKNEKIRHDNDGIDVCSESSIAAACNDVSARHGELYGLINNAGGWLSSAKDTIDLNTYAVINVTEAFLPLLLKKQGGNTFVF